MRVSKQFGFSLVEALVALAIIALLAALVIPAAKNQLDKGEVGAVASNLQALRDAVLAFRENVGFYPIKLTQLADKPGDPGISDRNSCGGLLAATAIAKWRGPYVAQDLTTAGLRSGDVLIRDTLARSPSTSTPLTPEGTLAIEVDDAVNSVDQPFVTDVEQMFDPGASNLNAGTIRWTATAAPIGRMTFHIAIRGC